MLTGGIYERTTGAAGQPLGRGYQRRVPEHTVLHELVSRHAQTLLAELRDADGRGLPRHVERELAEYLRCGILAHGFLRLGCDTYHKELLVPFSCKRRGFCPSCAGRRMAQPAAHLDAITAAGFVPGFYETPLTSSGQFPGAFCSAVSAIPAIGSNAALWPDEPDRSGLVPTEANAPADGELQAPLALESSIGRAAQPVAHLRHLRACVSTLSVTGIPERTASRPRRSAGTSSPGASTFSPRPPQTSTTFS